MVSTIKYKQESEIDLKKSMEVTLQTLESQGAQNMIVNKKILKLKKESWFKIIRDVSSLTLILKTAKSCIMK
jgi:hypothetical protein